MIMENVAQILTKLVSSYFETAKSGGRECRLAVPGLTPNISKVLHGALLERGIPSYLIIPRSYSAPDPDRKWIYAEGLTSKRDGSFIAVTFPGQLSRLQDSIIGSGGACHQAFSDEWPWIDDGLTTFRFKDEFLNEIINGWTNSEVDRQWISEFINYGLVPATSGMRGREERLLQEILGTFNAKGISSSLDLRKRFLFHCGIPLPINSLSSTNVQGIIAELKDTCSLISRACLETSKRQEVIGRVDEKFEDEELRAQLKDYLNVFFDGIGAGDGAVENGILNLFEGWGNPKNYTNWECLTSEVIRDLFDLKIIVKTGRIEINFSCPENTLGNPEEKFLAMFHGDNIPIEVKYSGLPAGSESNFSVRINVGRATIIEEHCNAQYNPINFELSTGDIKNYKNKIFLTARLLQGDKLVRQARVELHLCGELRPAFLILEPSFTVIDPAIENDIEEVPKFEIDETAYLYLFDAERNGNPHLTIADEVVDFGQYRGGDVLRSSTEVDPSSSPTGIVRVLIEKQSEYCFQADIEGKTQRTGEFSLENEMLSRLSEGSVRHLKNLLAVFTTGDEVYPGLGGLTLEVMGRVRISRLFEKFEQGHLPLFANLLATSRVIERSDGYIRHLEGVDIRGISGGMVRGEVAELIANYASIRVELLELIWQGIPDSRDKPKYAELPIYIKDKEEKISEILGRYLAAYSSNIDFLSQSQGQLNWTESTLLTFVDCLVNWSNTESKGKFYLFGPWHPLVIAKRFMTQKALFLSGIKFLAQRDNRFSFNKLTALLNQNESISWGPCLNSQNKKIESGYVSSTSDAGWLLCINHKHVDLLSEVVQGIKGNLALETRLFSLSREGMAESYIRRFADTFPSRRSIGVRVSKGYSPDRIIESTQKLLYTENGVTDFGTQLPGGIHFFFSDELRNVDEQIWRSPPMALYEYKDDEECASKHQLDISLLPRSTSIAFDDHDETLTSAMPRGRDNLAFLTWPSRRAMIGADGIPNSSINQWPVSGQLNNNLGEIFTETLARIARALPSALVSSWQLNLPQELKSQWNVLQGPYLDPATFVAYVRNGYERYGQPRALWDYKVSIADSSTSYFIISPIAHAVQASLNGSPVFGGQDLAGEIVQELGSIGIAIGGESIRSTQKALGVIGLVGAIRLFAPNNPDSPLLNDDLNAGFLLPVDSFSEILGPGLDNSIEHQRRTDLVAIQLSFSNDNNLKIGFCAIECKYTGTLYSENEVPKALEQASQTYDRLLALFEEALKDDGITERLAIINLIGFGLRLISNTNNSSENLEIKIIQCLLDGKFTISQVATKSLLVSTECKFDRAEIKKRGGWWIRLAPKNWPGVTESESLKLLRQSIRGLFFKKSTAAVIPTINVNSSEVTPDAEVPEASIEPVATSGSQDGISHETAQSEVTDETSPLYPILIGVDDQRRRVTFDPMSSSHPLDNYNLMISGSSGKGKTQFIKALVLQLRNQNRGVFLLDFKNDFASDAVFCREAGLQTQYVTFDGLPFNPLIPFPRPHPVTGNLVVHCSEHITGLTAVLARTYGLQVQQEMALKEAVRECYRACGINPSGASPYDSSQQYPDFNDVGERIKISNPRAYNRLDPLFDLQIFQEGNRDISFEAVLTRSLVIDLSSIQSDPIKNALAQIIILSAHGFYNSQPHVLSPRQFFVFDEASRVLSSDYLTRFVRECRAYGVGIVLSTQYLSDFSPDVSASISTKIIHGNDADEVRVREIQSILGLRGEETRISKMGIFDAIITNPQYRNVFIKTVTYPHFLVLRKIANEGATQASLNNIHGLNTNRMPLEVILDQLLQRGLIEEVNGVFKPLKPN